MKLLNIEIKYYFLIHTHTHTHLTLYAKFNMHRTSVSYTIVTVDLSQFPLFTTTPHKKFLCNQIIYFSSHIETLKKERKYKGRKQSTNLSRQIWPPKERNFEFHFEILDFIFVTIGFLVSFFLRICNIMEVPFTFLGIPVGANPKKKRD